MKINNNKQNKQTNKAKKRNRIGSLKLMGAANSQPKKHFYMAL